MKAVSHEWRQQPPARTPQGLLPVASFTHFVCAATGSPLGRALAHAERQVGRPLRERLPVGSRAAMVQLGQRADGLS